VMKAAVYRKFGGPEVVNIEDVPKPSPKPGEVLIKIHATTVSIADHRVRALDLPKGLWFFGPLALGIFGPRKKILGMDLAGTVEAVGGDVTEFKTGDEVIAIPGNAFGCHAEYTCMSQDGAIALKPKNMNFDQAVTLVFGGTTAAEYLSRVAINKGTTVLVNGASGATGTAAVQLASIAGATVTGVCSGGNASLVTSLGADHIIDYAKEDFAKNGKTYDVIVECVGNAPFSRVDASINPGGALILIIASLGSMLTASYYSRKSGKLVTAKDWKPTAKGLQYLIKLAESGVYKAVIDRTYDLNDIVAAHEYVDTGRKKGNVVVRVA